MNKFGNVLRRHIDFYNTALTEVANNPLAKTFRYNDWDFNLAEALEDFSKDLKDGKLTVSVEAKNQLS